MLNVDFWSCYCFDTLRFFMNITQSLTLLLSEHFRIFQRQEYHNVYHFLLYDLSHKRNVRTHTQPRVVLPLEQSRRLRCQQQLRFIVHCQHWVYLVYRHRRQVHQTLLHPCAKRVTKCPILSTVDLRCWWRWHISISKGCDPHPDTPLGRPVQNHLLREPDRISHFHTCPG